MADAQAEMPSAPLPPMVAYTYSDHNNGRTAYVFAYSRATDGSNAAISFSPGELGIGGTAYVYSYFAKTGQIVNAQLKFGDTAGADGNYYIVAPVGLSGIALLGDTGKFVSAGHQRLPQVQDQGILTATIRFAAGEANTSIQGYSPTAPIVTAVTGTASQLSYDPVAHIFTLTVAPDSSGSHVAVVSITTS